MLEAKYRPIDDTRKDTKSWCSANFVSYSNQYLRCGSPPTMMQQHRKVLRLRAWELHNLRLFQHREPSKVHPSRAANGGQSGGASINLNQHASLPPISIHVRIYHAGWCFVLSRQQPDEAGRNCCSAIESNGKSLLRTKINSTHRRGTGTVKQINRHWRHITSAAVQCGRLM